MGRAESEKLHATGGREALDRCIEVEREAAREMETDDPGRATTLANLAASLILRGEQSPGGADLDEADSLLTRAIGLTAAGSPDYAVYLYNRGTGESQDRRGRTRVDRRGGSRVP